MITTWALPSDSLGWIYAVLAAALLLVPKSKLEPWLLRPSSRAFCGAVALTAAAGSALYISVYLQGGPRIIDATSYFLAARLEASGRFALEAAGPVASYAGRFLVATPEQNLAPIFPPGYPTLLALFMALGRPLWLGPVLGAALAIATYRLGLRLFGLELVARLAALLSVLSMCLRYHTADTMSHGLAALLFTLALYCSLSPGLTSRLAAGGCVGWLFATRPVSGLCCWALCAALSKWYGPRTTNPASVSLRARGRELVCFGLGALPGLALLLAQQQSATGSWLGSLQYLYYSRSDFPPDCFRVGFGPHIGCRFEHGDFVQQFMPHGYGVLDALRTTGRRLAAHWVDAANFEALGLALPFIALRGRKQRSVRLLTAAVLLQMLCYAPFYFDGNYPGGGARMFADVLPCEQLLLAWGAWQLGTARWVLLASLLGFALHTSAAHRHLRDRDGGRPAFEPAVLEQANLQHGVVFVDTDHGFNLGYDPDAKGRSNVLVARARGDALDRQLLDALGVTEAYRYRFDLSGVYTPYLEPYAPAVQSRVFGGSLWPPLASHQGSAYPANTCGVQGLALRPTAAAAVFSLSLQVPAQARIDVVSSAPIELVDGTLLSTSNTELGCTRQTFELSSVRSNNVLQLRARQPSVVAEVAVLPWNAQP